MTSSPVAKSAGPYIVLGALWTEAGAGFEQSEKRIALVSVAWIPVILEGNPGCDRPMVGSKAVVHDKFLVPKAVCRNKQILFVCRDVAFAQMFSKVLVKHSSVLDESQSHQSALVAKDKLIRNGLRTWELFRTRRLRCQYAMVGRVGWQKVQDRGSLCRYWRSFLRT